MLSAGRAWIVTVVSLAVVLLLGVPSTAYGYDDPARAYDRSFNAAPVDLVRLAEAAVGLAPGPAGDLRQICDSSGFRYATNTARGGDSLVLGKYPDYIRLADELAARRFSIPDAVWDAMGPTERWAANQAVLDQAIADRIPIVLSNPATPEFLTGTFGDEIAYRIKQGYEIGPDALSMVPGGS